MKRFTKAEFETEFGEGRASAMPNGQFGIRGGVHVTCKAVDGPAPIVEFTASDETLDRYDEIITAAGWQIANYRRNPVFQNSHKYGDVLFTLGKSLVTEVRNNALFQQILFAVDVNPVAKIAYELYRGGFLNAVSVGFVPIRWETGSEQLPYRRKYLEQELLELSAVSIPANPNALQLAAKAGAVSREELQEAEDFIRAFVGAKDFCGDTAGLDSNTGARGIETDGAQLLQLARDLRNVLKSH